MAGWSRRRLRRFGGVAFFFVLGVGLVTAVGATTSWQGWARPVATSAAFEAGFAAGRDQALAEVETRVEQQAATAFARGLGGGADAGGQVAIQAVRLLALHTVSIARAATADGYEVGYEAGWRDGGGSS